MATLKSQLNNGVAVYVATFDKSVMARDVEPTLRNEAVQQCKDTLTKQQRYCVWRLLNYALTQQYGKGVQDYNFKVSNGKWVCDEVCFSLTHCDNVVAVAVSSDDVGIDVEAVANFSRHANDAKFAERVLTPNELSKFEAATSEQKTQAIAMLWTRKESLFKLDGSGAFVPGFIDTCTQQSNTYCQILRIDGVEYSLAVATKYDLAFAVQVVKDQSIFE